MVRLPANQVVGISNTRFTLNGIDRLPKGLEIRGSIAPTAFEKTDDNRGDYTARKNYGASELAAARDFGADELRFQVSQPSMDPQSPLCDAHYVLTTEDVIATARKASFVVIISMQDEPRSGEPKQHPLPTAATERDWMELNARFGMDRGIMFELYNEPSLDVAIDHWNTWAYGGQLPQEDDPSIGMQGITDDLRLAGSLNVIILDGLKSAGTLLGATSVIDPLQRIAYAVHPYQFGSDNECKWDQRFELESQCMPVIITEWSAETKSFIGLRDLPDYHVAVDLLNYLTVHSIPLSAGAFDITNFMSQDVPGWRPTNYDNYCPLQDNDNAGLLVQKLFRKDYAISLTIADGVTH